MQGSWLEYFKRRHPRGGQTPPPVAESIRAEVSQERPQDPITGTPLAFHFERAVGDYHFARVEYGRDPEAGRNPSTGRLEGEDHRSAGARIYAGDPSQEFGALESRARSIGQAVKGFLARYDGQRTQSEDATPSLTSGHSTKAETAASRLLAQSPEVLESLTPEQRGFLGEIRAFVPFIREGAFTRHIDAAELLRWYEQKTIDATFEGHAEAQAAAEIRRTLEKLFPAERNEPLSLEARLKRIAHAQQARGEAPRLHMIGVGGEGAVFADSQGRGVYKVHPGGAEDSAMGIGSMRPGERLPTHVEIFRVPLTETLRRYCRQSLLAISCPTEIKGVTENGRLITRQPLLDADRATTDTEITHMMAQVGGRRIEIDGKGRELRHCYVAPDKQGNWLLAVDLKPANVLREKAGGAPLLIDGIIAPITREIVARNPQLLEYQATRPEAQF